MKEWKVVTISVLASLTAVIGGVLLVDWLAWRNFQQRGSDPLTRLLHSSMANALVVPVQTQINEKQSPQMFATYVNALGVGIAAARISRTGTLPQTSEGIQSLEPHDRVDGWGHPFCLVASGTRVAVISAGPEGEPFPGCRNLSVGERDIIRLGPVPMYQFPSGSLVLVVDSKSLRP